MTTFGQRSFYKAIDEILAGIGASLELGLVVPTQMLIFGAIDAFSYIEMAQVVGQKKRFEAWVNKRVLPHDKVFCEAIDLYAARSAIIHRLGVQSRLSESGQAQTIVYCHGTGSFELLIDLRDSIRLKSGKVIPIVRLEALSEALTKGVSSFLQEIEINPNLKRRMADYWDREQPYRFPA